MLALGAGAYLLLRDGGGEGPDPARAPSRGTSRRCVLSPEQTEGPFHVEESMVRRDVTEGQDGAPLELRLAVEDADSCDPIRGATVEIWHCNALGEYSGTGGGGTFLRGAQRSDRDGAVTFSTIYPGWYPGRAPHVHVKVHAGGDEVHTGQLYFEDDLSRAVYRRPPYADRGEAMTTNATDGIYGQGGRESTLEVRRRGRGYVGRLALGVRA